MTGHKRMSVPHQPLGNGAGTPHGMLGPKIIVDKEAGGSS